MKRRNRRTRDLQRDEYAGYFDDHEGPTRERARKPRDPGDGIQMPSWVLHLGILAGIALLLLGLVRFTAGGPAMEKTLQALAAPTGLLWIGLFLVTYFCLLYRAGFPAFLAGVCWLLLTLSGNSLVAGMLANSLQGRYTDFRMDQVEPLDVIAVLGGGLRTAPSGRPQIADGGDRAMLAYRLFQAGKVQRIICTGTSGLPLSEGELAQADALEAFLLSLGVPQQQLVKIGGRNTWQEIQALDKWMTENQGTKLKTGIVTSAWHLPRAMRLAEAVGIKAEPLPADFANTRVTQSPYLLIPGSGNLDTVTRCLKEYLAALVGR
jgi:uncharacterized SAM-binding protein YcdF (DUF218 family)